MPEGYRFKFLTANADPEALHDWIKTQSADLPPSETDLAGADPNARWGLGLACKTQLNNIGAWLTTGSSRGIVREHKEQSAMLEAVFRASIRLRDSDLFQKAVTLNPSMLSLDMWEELGSTMELAQFVSYRSL